MRERSDKMILKPKITEYSFCYYLKNEIGITYEEFEKLSFDKQLRIIEQHRQQKIKQLNNKKVRVMIGSGEHAIFIKKNRGERYMLDDGTFVRAGDTPEDRRARLEDKLDDIAYSKPVAFVKKLQRRIKRKKTIHK